MPEQALLSGPHEPAPVLFRWCLPARLACQDSAPRRAREGVRGFQAQPGL